MTASAVSTGAAHHTETARRTRRFGADLVGYSEYNTFMDPLVAFLLGKFAAAAGTATFEGVLRELLDLRSAQADMLKRIEANVDLLIT